jgi:KRAB domain-containing zinc finger protein
MLHHTEGETYMCQHCPKTFSNPLSLKNHIKSCTLEYDKKCDLCGKCFKTEWRLKQHQAVAHSDARPYSCEWCGKTYKMKRGVKRHQLESCRKVGVEVEVKEDEESNL